MFIFLQVKKKKSAFISFLEPVKNCRKDQQIASRSLVPCMSPADLLARTDKQIQSDIKHE